MEGQLASLRRRERMRANSQVGSQAAGREESSMREWLTLREMQEILGIGKTKGYELVATGEIPSVRIGRSIRISREDLQHWLEEQRYPRIVKSSSR
jgi:excisionase family DNA binding protein